MSQLPCRIRFSASPLKRDQNAAFLRRPLERWFLASVVITTINRTFPFACPGPSLRLSSMSLTPSYSLHIIIVNHARAADAGRPPSKGTSCNLPLQLVLFGAALSDASGVFIVQYLVYRTVGCQSAAQDTGRGGHLKAISEILADYVEMDWVAICTWSCLLLHQRETHVQL